MLSLMSHKSKAHVVSGRPVHAYATVAVRDARPEDEAAIRRVAALDDKPVALDGRVLVAEVDGAIVAALPIGGIAVADPFRPTSDVVALLKMRADQIKAGESAPRSARAGAVPAVARTA